jgi:hypothetical protein
VTLFIEPRENSPSGGEAPIIEGRSEVAAPALLDASSEHSGPKSKMSWRSLRSWMPFKKMAKQGASSETSPPPLELPIQVVLGFLPEVSVRDAKEYALGIAEKHFEQMGLVFYAAFPFKSGYIFEIHEGGHGKAYAPEIVSYFDAHGEFDPSNPLTAVIKTATRAVEVQRTREGLTAIWLPTQHAMAPSEWLHPRQKMTPALHRRTNFMLAGLALFLAGFVAVMTAGTVFRLRPIEPAAAVGDSVIRAEVLPLSQMEKLLQMPAGTVKALKFSDGKWQPIETIAPVASSAPVATIPNGSPPGAPAAPSTGANLNPVPPSVAQPATPAKAVPH